MNFTLRISARMRNLDQRTEARQSKIRLAYELGDAMAQSRNIRRPKLAILSAKSKPKTFAACRTHNKKSLSLTLATSYQRGRQGKDEHSAGVAGYKSR